MRKPHRINLLEFLSRPRFVHEIAEHYGVSRKTAVLHLQKAVRSGRVLVSEAPVFQTVKDSSGNLKKLGGFVYVHHKSPTHTWKETSFTLLENNDLPRLSNRTSPKNHATKPDANYSLISKLNMTSARATSGSRARLSHACAPRYQNPASIKSRPLQCVEKNKLFQELLSKPLPFLDLHERFNVSKQTITGLVKRGLLEETWGSDGVGVTFNLTSKGKTHLEELRAGSRYKPTIKRSSLTRLKQRSV